NEGDWNTVSASLIDGDYRSGEYKAVIPMNVTEEGTLTYQWVITDFGNNTVTSDEYVVNVISSITVGYFHDFENEPSGWTVIGTANNWEWGVATFGPGSAFPGEKVYATKLDDNYSTNMEKILVMPTVKVPEGESYLQFQHWHGFEYDSFDNIPYDFGYVVFSTDMETWYVIHEVFGNSNGWEEVVIDLSDLAGQTISLGFYAYSDSLFTYPGWYIDDVALLDQLPEGVTKEEVSSQSIATTNYKSIKLESTTVTEGITVDAEEPSGLPLVAQITVVETGRS